MTLIRTRRQTIARVFPHPNNRRVLVHARSGAGLVGNNPEIMFNGGLVGNANGWTPYQGAIAWQSNGYAILTGSIDYSIAQAYQGRDLTAGKTYRLRIGLSSLDGEQVHATVSRNSVRVASTQEYNGASPAVFEVDFVPFETGNHIIAYEIFTLATAAVRLGMHGCSLKESGPA